MEGSNRRLMWHGMCLFLIGLLTGFAEQHFANMRMGLAAHLEGVMNGTFLVALGAAWTERETVAGDQGRSHTGPRFTGLMRNWFVTTLAAAFGTVALSPITGASHSGHPPGKRTWSRLDSLQSVSQSSPPRRSFSGVFARERSRDLELRKPHAESSHPRVPELLRHGIAPIGPCCHQDFCLFPAFAYYLGGHAAPTELRGPDDFKRNV